jgi:ubiquinol-cytochrome c reductase cytochrome c subunit
VSRRLRLPVAVLCGMGAIAIGAFSLADGADGADVSSAASKASASINAGRQLFQESCASCHGFDAAGVGSRGPDLRAAGAGAADFYLRTGRMPLANPGDQPLRGEPRFDDGQIDDLVAYLGSLGGPRRPRVDPSAGSVSDGQELFTSSCSGCHAISGEGGVAVGAFAPALKEATPTEIAEAIRVGPYVMPPFGRRQLSDADVNSITRYIREVVDSPEDRGGWGIGHIGPVPEGMIAWLLAAVALVLVARIIGDRKEDQA